MLSPILHPNHCVDCGFLKIECICSDSQKIEKLKNELIKLERENQRLNEFIDGMAQEKTQLFKEYEALEKEIVQLKQEIENLKYRNNYLAECALEEQAQLKEALTKLLSLHCERCEDPAECDSCGWHLATKQLIK